MQPFSSPMMQGGQAALTPAKLFTWGYGGTQGSLGQGATTSVDSPVQIGTDLWNSIAAGMRHVVAVRDNGTLWTWGFNSSGQLGDGTTANKSSPIQVGALTTWAAAFASIYSSFAVKSDGTLWSWGRNSSGQLGDGTTANQSSPVQIGALTTWGNAQFVSPGAAVLVRKADGTLWSWGQNNLGQLGDGTTANKSSPVQIGALNDWVTVGGGYNFALAVRGNGTLWAWGDGANGRLGDGTIVSKSSPIQIGALTTWAWVSNSTGALEGGAAAVKTDGTMWSWGQNNLGQLADGTTVNKSSPVQIGALVNWNAGRAQAMSFQRQSAAFIKADNTLWASGRAGGIGWTEGPTNVASPVQVGSGSKWAAVASGIYWGVALSN